MSDSENSNASDTEEEYEVERILAESVANGTTIYLVKWQNYDDNECTWEPAESFMTPATLADWQRQLANNDTLDDDEVARVQARMDAFKLAQEEQALGKSFEGTQTTLKRQRESPPTHNQPTTKRARESPTSPKQLGSNASLNPKKGIAQIVRPIQASSASSARPSRMSGSPSYPSSAAIKAKAVTPASAPNPVSRPRDMAQPPVNRPHDIGAPSKPMAPKLDKISDLAGPKKSNVSNTTSKAGHIKDMAGHRFKNLSHQNNFIKKARREPAPDMSKLDLRSPDDWSSRPVPKSQDESRRASDRGSPLYVPEEGRELHADIETTSPRMSSSRSPTAIHSAAEQKSTASEKFSSTAASERQSLSGTAHRPQLTGDNLQVPAPSPAPDIQHREKLTDFIDMTSSMNPGNRETEERPTESKTAFQGHSSTTTKNVHLDRLPTVIRAEAPNSIAPTTAGEAPKDRRLSMSHNSHVPNNSYQSGRRDSHPSQYTTEQPRFQHTNQFYPPVSDKVLTATNGRSYKKGEVIVCLKFGDHAVGDVRLVHLPRWTSGKVLHLKEMGAKSLSIHFRQSWVLDPVAFSALSHDLDRRHYGVGAFEAYDDTLAACESLCQYLEGSNLGAIWEYPDPGETLILVLYSSRAPGWQHLDQLPLPESESPLHVAVLNKLPGVVLDSTPTRSNEPVLSQQFIGPSQPRSNVSRPELRVFTSESAVMEARSPTDLPAQASAKPIRRDSVIVSHTLKSPRRRDSTSFGEFMDWAPSTPAVDSSKSFFANFDVMVNGLEKQTKPRVFIAFATSHPGEAATVKDWLSQHVGPRWIFSDDQEKDWKDFREEVISQPGLLLFHEEYPSYCDMLHLYKFLRPASLWCYNVSFNHHGNPLSRLFPRGTALCITEDTLTNHADGALSALKWFEESSLGKAQSWKLVLPPDFISYIVARLNSNKDDARHRYMSMLEIWYRLRDRAFEVFSHRRSHHEDPERFIKAISAVEDEQLVISPAGLPEYVNWDHAGSNHDAVSTRDRALLEFFLGWSIKNVTKHRLFVVVDTEHKNRTEKQVCHIWFREPASFGRQEK